jgi:hypothetical protein
VIRRARRPRATGLVDPHPARPDRVSLADQGVAARSFRGRHAGRWATQMEVPGAGGRAAATTAPTRGGAPRATRAREVVEHQPGATSSRPGRRGCGGARRRPARRRRRPPRRRAGRSRDCWHGQPPRARVVREDPAHGVGHREDEPAAGPQHPGDLPHRAGRVGDRRGCRRRR